MPDDHALADLLSTLAGQYHKQIEDRSVPINRTRLEMIRKIELISQSIRGLMKSVQGGIAGNTDH